MPAQTRRGLRRTAAAATRGAELKRQLDAWAELFIYGCDTEGLAADLGVPTDNAGQVTRAVAKEAWRKFGLPFLSRFEGQDTSFFCMMRHFGDPRTGAVPPLSDQDHGSAPFSDEPWDHDRADARLAAFGARDTVSKPDRHQPIACR